MKKRIRAAIFLITILILILVFLFPLYLVLKISLSKPQDIFVEKPTYLIKNFTFEHFKSVLLSGETFLNPLKKSLLTGILASILGLLVSIPAAYSISKFNYKLKYALILVIFMTRMIPEISIALPITISFIKIGLFDNILGLTLAHLIRILPVSCFILVGVFSGFPDELERQARIDGASASKAFIKVVLPLSLGGITVAGIFSFLLSWDEFIYASYLTLARPTMPIKMYYYISRGDIFSSATYAVIITIPVLILTFALQKYIKPDFLSGAIKG
ncbi:MAG: carbohydrate ABC transporter permease [Candidatus Omnitrophota bacterium]|nr:MAG: carbohydrate ABC transporter permease [Candidatus Omnitrophota bacterium]